MTEKTPIYFIGGIPMFFEIMENAELKRIATDMNYREYIVSEEWQARGKAIIQQIIDGFNSELYDYYNRVNIDILDAALSNQDRRNYERAKENGWDHYESEGYWREANDYWEWWK